MKINVRPYSNPRMPKSKFRVRYTVNGKQVSKYFASERKAKAFAKEQADLAKKAGREVAAMAPADLREILDCIKMLKPTGATLREAVDAYVSEWERQRAHRAIAFGDALVLFLGVKEKEGLRPRSLQTLRIRLTNFAAGREQDPLGAFTKDDCAAWIHRGTIRNQINNRAVLSNLFRWAEGEGYCDNPVARIKKPKEDDHEPEILTIPQCRRLMEAAQTHRGGEWIPYHVLTLFCGVRPAEAARLPWGAIDLDEATVIIEGKEAKMRARRTIPLCGNAIAWLAPHATAQTPLCPPGAAKNLRAIHKAAGIDPWPQDAARHTCISAWMKLHGEIKAAEWAGNSPDVCHRHYKGRMSAAVAKEFFEIRPDADKIVSFEGRAAK